MPEQIINLNDEVEFTLITTPSNLCVLFDAYRNPFKPDDADYITKYLDTCQPRWKEGKLRMPLWEMMRVFGPKTHHGMSPMFERNELRMEER